MRSIRNLFQVRLKGESPIAAGRTLAQDRPQGRNVYIYLPIAELSVNIFLLLGLGIGVGMLSGIFGVGGGFLMTPLLIFLGISPPIAVGTEAVSYTHLTLPTILLV